MINLIIFVRVTKPPKNKKNKNMKKIIFQIFTVASLLVSSASAQCIEGNCFNGNGKFIFKNGDMYNGQWLKGKMDGQGTYTWKNGDIYKGAFFEGQLEGRGTITFKNGDRYIGTWENNKMQGRGHYIWKTPGDAMAQNKFEGDWNNGEQVYKEIQPIQEIQQQEQK